MKYSYFSKKVGKENGFGSGGDVGDLGERVEALETSVGSLNDFVDAITTTELTGTTQIQTNVETKMCDIELTEGIYIIKSRVSGSGMQNKSVASGISDQQNTVFGASLDFEETYSAFNRITSNLTTIVKISEPTTLYLNATHDQTASKNLSYDVVILKLK